MSQVIIAGATGMVGGAALRLCLEHPDVESVTSISRRPTGLDHPKLRERLHGDFLDYSSIEEVFEGQDLALFCIGAYTGTLPDEEFRKITVDVSAAFAEALQRKSPKAVFCFLSGAGADQSEKSRMSFARYKGAAEKDLQERGFSRLHIFRPGYIYPVEPREEPNLSYRIFRMLYPVVRLLAPNAAVPSEDLAFAMVEAGLQGQELPGHILENRDIRAWVAKLRSRDPRPHGDPNDQ